MFAVASAQIFCSLFRSIFEAPMHSKQSIVYLFEARVVADKTLEVLRRHNGGEIDCSFRHRNGQIVI